MAKQTLEEVEKRFLELRKTFDEKEWKNAEILLKKVDVIASSDIPLAYRLMQRVKNLAPSSESRRQLSILKRQLITEHPELMALSSVQGSRSDKALDKMSLMVEKTKLRMQTTDLKMMLKPFSILVLIPLCVFAFYQIIWASERFESRTQLILKQPDGMATMDPAMALLSGFGATTGANDNELLKAFILSSDMITYLQDKVALSAHYQGSEFDFFSRLSSSATQEDLHSYFTKHVGIEIDEKSSVITLRVQGFTPQFSQRLAQAIVERGEWYINEIGHGLAKEQMGFVQNEHIVIEKRLQKAKTALLTFQREHDLLDPEAEGLALQQITYSLEGEIAKKHAQLRALSSAMSEKAPAVMQIQAELNSLSEQLNAQRNRLIHGSGQINAAGQQADSVGEVLAKFSDLKIDLELALKAYSSSQISLEKSRIEAYRQLKYLVVVESPTLPEESSYPKVFYNLSLYLIVALMLFLIGRIVNATVNELR
jgi:capsular polysaccharide transport system permease protein